MWKNAEHFGEMVFGDKEMKARLTGPVYESLRRTIKEGGRLDSSLADPIAAAMRDWALEKGATHYTHWFQPMTGITAEKHDSFLSPSEEGGAVAEFSGRELIQGEPDASSFPNGGLRATFEARGYTVWDASSYAFIKENTLCIPTAFCSYNGAALDKKTPLLRSMDDLNKEALRIVRLFGNTTAKKVSACVGAEQEYFLIDREMFYKRKDLVYANRTLFGARPPKGQEMDDHYSGVIKPRVKAFMDDLDRELWKLGIPAKTEHNEEAPAQHELACVYLTANLTADQNQLTMEMMQKIAAEHGLVCLLHEKPFEGVNGSGKHNNWSLATDDGVNLLSPGETPHENAQFLLFLSAVLKAVDDYQDLLRLSVATAGNDHRLGASEAPPAVVSIFLGTELTAVLEAIENDEAYSNQERRTMKLGAESLPRFRMDTTDRNRTSPFAFTGNKFEFRMLGSANSISCANVMINAAVSEALRLFADELEAAEDFDTALHGLIRRTIREHGRIIFNGNGYDETWIREATEVRGLHNYLTTPDCLPHILDPENVKLLTSHRIFSEEEIRSRMEVLLENYNKTLEIEARTMVEMARKQIMPAVASYCLHVAETARAKREFVPEGGLRYEKRLLKKLSMLQDSMDEKTERLSSCLEAVESMCVAEEKAKKIRDTFLPVMEALRREADEAETLTAKEYWPFPTYGDLFFSVDR